MAKQPRRPRGSGRPAPSGTPTRPSSAAPSGGPVADGVELPAWPPIGWHGPEHIGDGESPEVLAVFGPPHPDAVSIRAWIDKLLDFLTDRSLGKRGRWIPEWAARGLENTDRLLRFLRGRHPGLPPFLDL